MEPKQSLFQPAVPHGGLLLQVNMKNLGDEESGSKVAHFLTLAHSRPSTASFAVPRDSGEAEQRVE